MQIGSRGKRVFPVIAAIAVVLRLYLSQQGHNYDLESWEIVSGMALRGQSVYELTVRYPYAPIGIYVLAALRAVSQWVGGSDLQVFHLVLAAFLSMVDVGISSLLFRMYGLLSAIFYLLSPVSLLITGYHSQIDNVAMLLGLFSWMLIQEPPRRPGNIGPAWLRRWPERLYVSAVVMGISLSLKHIFFLFPIWLVLSERRRFCGVRRLIFYCAIAYGVFGATFLGYLWVHPNSWTSIVFAVFQYRGYGFFGNALAPSALKLVASFIGVSSFVAVVYTPLWIGSLLLLGWLSRRQPQRDLYIYLAGLVFFTPVITDQYLVIPLLGAAAFPLRLESSLYTLVASLVLTYSGQNIGGSEKWGPFLKKLPLEWATWIAAQIALGFLLIVLLIGKPRGWRYEVSGRRTAIRPGS